jgi:hypothetical protein
MLITDPKDWYTARDVRTKLAGGDGSNLTELISVYGKDDLAAWMTSKGVNNAWIGLTTDPNGC